MLVEGETYGDANDEEEAEDDSDGDDDLEGVAVRGEIARGCRTRGIVRRARWRRVLLDGVSRRTGLGSRGG